MRRVTIEVPAEGNLLRKSGQADVWLKPLIGPVERAKLDSHSSVTLMNDIVHASLKVNLIGTEMMKRVTLSEQLVRDYQVEADNWKEQCESLQIDVEILEESKSTLEKQVRALTSELAVEKAYSNQAGKEKDHLETSFSEQLSKASEEIRELRALLGEKEAYADELVQNLTQTQEDLRVSSDKVCSLENSHASLQASYESALAKNEKLRNEITDWERDYEILEDKTSIEVSWGFLNSLHDTLIEVSQENFNLKSELAKIK
uniref:Myosin-1-like n=1 Tax=Nicotiana tabacum TaxID=4097 RepID=A0A1S3ZTP3_TOBAC|nr:PREDICTED: myosin-1-like [Nicotiana tabacum]